MFAKFGPNLTSFEQDWFGAYVRPMLAPIRRMLAKFRPTKNVPKSLLLEISRILAKFWKRFGLGSFAGDRGGRSRAVQTPARGSLQNRLDSDEKCPPPRVRHLSRKPLVRVPDATGAFGLDDPRACGTNFRPVPILER